MLLARIGDTKQTTVGKEVRSQRLGTLGNQQLLAQVDRWISASESWPDVGRASVAELLVPGVIGGPSLLNPADPAATTDLEPQGTKVD